MIPNVVYFIFGFKEQTEDFMFVYYLSVYSCFLVNNPDKINFYYHFEPKGEWWEKLKEIPTVELHQVDIPNKIGDKPIKKVAHKADKLRMDLLLEHGGIYLDIDTICVKPYHHFLKEKVVLGEQIPLPGICNAIMMTEPKTEFFKIWLDNYEENFNPDGWDESSIFLPLEISKKVPDLLTLQKPEVFFLPHFRETYKIFRSVNNIPSNLVALHLWESYSMKYIKEIKNWYWIYNNATTLYGKMMLNLIENYIVNDENVFYVKLEDLAVLPGDIFILNKDAKLFKTVNQKNKEVLGKQLDKVEPIFDLRDGNLLVNIKQINQK